MQGQEGRKFLFSPTYTRALTAFGVLVGLCLAGYVSAMDGKTHYQVTASAQRLLAEARVSHTHLLALPRGTSAVGTMKYERLRWETVYDLLGMTPPAGRGGPINDYAQLSARHVTGLDVLALQSFVVDYYRDLELVDVEGGAVDHGRDDPHRDEAFAVDDKPHYSERSKVFTAFNHFIDIKKGPGRFDDYDGYSYQHGSARRDQYQRARETLDDPWEDFLALLAGDKFVDEGLSWWYNDEYVHARAEWYRGCSPAVRRYSFPGDRGIHVTPEAELRDRFPLAHAVGGAGRGFPYSVFMPVDNMARYWYNEFLRTGDLLALGPVLHAIQDASVPHHASGYLGNWHGRYETDLGRQVLGWLADAAFNREVIELVARWSRIDQPAPATLGRDDWRRTPRINWTVDQLVTWVALNAYRAYDRTYNHFRGGYRFNVSSARELTKLALAMSVLVLSKAAAATETRPDYDLGTHATYALWTNDRGMNLPFQASDTDDRGFALVRTTARLEDGSAHTNVLETHPRWARDGSITGDFHLVIPQRARFSCQLGFRHGATASDGVVFYLNWIPLARSDQPPPPSVALGSWTARHDGRLDSVEVDLSRFAGQRGLLELRVSAGASAAQDWAVWVNPRVATMR